MYILATCPFANLSMKALWAGHVTGHFVEQNENLLVILTPVTAKHCSRMFILVQHFSINSAYYTGTETEDKLQM